MGTRFCVALAIVSVVVVGCGVEDRLPLGATGGSGGEAGQGGSGGGTAGSGGSDDPGCVLEERTDVFGPAPRPQVDILWVIDNSKAMAPFADRVAGNLAGLLASLDGAWTDYRHAVTTTGLEESPDCDGPVGGGEDGRFVPVDGSRPRILDASTPDLAAVWSENIAVGACHDSSHPLEAAWRALSEPLVNHEKDPRHDTEWMDGNAGFLRPGAWLSIIVVTPVGDVAADDGRSPSDYLGLFQTIKADGESVSVSAITGPMESQRTNGCQAEAGDRLIDLAESSFGFAVDICKLSADGSEWFPARIPPPLGFYLREQPSDKNGDGVVDESDLVVSVDGVEVSARTTDGDLVWVYAPGTNTLKFASEPHPGSVVRVTYLACSPQSG